jgi:hypothetical protein
MQTKCNVNVRLKIVADSKNFTAVNIVTMLQKNWLIESAKGKQGNGTMRDVLVHRKIKIYSLLPIILAQIIRYADYPCTIASC